VFDKKKRRKRFGQLSWETFVKDARILLKNSSTISTSRRSPSTSMTRTKEGQSTSILTFTASKISGRGLNKVKRKRLTLIPRISEDGVSASATSKSSSAMTSKSSSSKSSSAMTSKSSSSKSSSAMTSKSSSSTTSKSGTSKSTSIHRRQSKSVTRSFRKNQAGSGLLEKARRKKVIYPPPSARNYPRKAKKTTHPSTVCEEFDRAFKDIGADESSKLNESGTGFKNVNCPICHVIPTHHRCYAEVDGGFSFNGKQICGKAFCAPCGSKWGCEGSPWRCSDHV